jgi:hypothetical protein
VRGACSFGSLVFRIDFRLTHDPFAALVDVLKSQFRGPKDKLRWAAVITLGGIVGAILYFAIGTRYKRPELS